MVRIYIFHVQTHVQSHVQFTVSDVQIHIQFYVLVCTAIYTFICRYIQPHLHFVLLYIYRDSKKVPGVDSGFPLELYR